MRAEGGGLIRILFLQISKWDGGFHNHNDCVIFWKRENRKSRFVIGNVLISAIPSTKIPRTKAVQDASSVFLGPVHKSELYTIIYMIHDTIYMIQYTIIYMI